MSGVRNQHDTPDTDTCDYITTDIDTCDYIELYQFFKIIIIGVCVHVLVLHR